MIDYLLIRPAVEAVLLFFVGIREIVHLRNPFDQRQLFLPFNDN